MMFKNKNISVIWLLLWTFFHIALGFACFYLGYFVMILLALFTFPLLQTLLLILRFNSDKSGYWLLIYLPIFISAGLINFVHPIVLTVIGIFFIELILYLITHKFGNFVFSAISLIGLALIFQFVSTSFFQNLELETRLFFLLFLSSFFIGFGIESHRWKII